MNCPRLVAKENTNTDPSLIVFVEQLEEGSGTLRILGGDGGADCEVSWQSRVVDLPFFSNQERKVLDQVVVLHGGLSAQTCVNCSQGIVAGEEQDEKKKFESSHFVHCIDAITRWKGVHQLTYLHSFSYSFFQLFETAFLKRS